MLEITISKYLSLVASLKIGDFIIFYFTVYFFILLIQRALGFKIDTDSQLKTNPRILASLILVQIFNFLHSYIEIPALSQNRYALLVSTGLIFVLGFYLFGFLFLSNKGPLKYIFAGLKSSGISKSTTSSKPSKYASCCT